MEDRRRPLALPFAFTVLVAPGCGVQDGPANHLLLTAAAGPNTGGMLVAFAPTDSTFAAEQARVMTAPNLTTYDVLVDGELAMLDDDAGRASPVTVMEGGTSQRGYLSAGPHHFTIGPPGGPSVFDGDGEVPGGGTVHLFLLGPLQGLQGRFVSTPDMPAAGNEHVTVVNLMRSGQAIEVVSCTEVTCTPISDALALGDDFDTEVPAVLSEDPTSSLTDEGTGVGYRLVPSASVPAPPVLPLFADPPAIFVAAPVYMSDQGQLQVGFN
jgi:hypothetical protein